MIIAVGTGTALEIIATLWLVWGIYWLLAALGRAGVRRQEPAWLRATHVALMVLAFVLLYSENSRLAALRARFVPARHGLEALGVGLVIAGLGFSVWARVCLGRNWSAEVRIRQDHKLIRTGPYAKIRHPIYTGLLLALAGTALAIGEYRALAGLAVITLAFILKGLREERLLAKEFGAEFEEHKRRTGFFLPRWSGQV